MTIRVTTKFDARKIQLKVAAASFRSLGHAGGAIRLTARRSIRRRKTTSQPGNPPHTQTGRLKRSIRYEVIDGDTVVVGPVNELAGKIWNLHEFGGKTQRRKLRQHRFAAGEFGPVAVEQAGSKNRFRRGRIRTVAQAERANRLVEAENARRATAVRYPKRPFMGPALDVNRSRLPKFWANSVK
jgi:phage gpG-like protein